MEKMKESEGHQTQTAKHSKNHMLKEKIIRRTVDK